MYSKKRKHVSPHNNDYTNDNNNHHTIITLYEPPLSKRSKIDSDNFLNLLPQDVTVEILKYLSLESLAYTSIASTWLQTMIVESSNEYRIMTRGQKLLNASTSYNTRSTWRSKRYYESLFCKTGVRELGEGLLTLKHTKQLRGITILDAMLTDNGYTALKEGLLTEVQANQCPGVTILDAMLTDKGLKAMREGVITITQANQYNSIWSLEARLNEVL